MIRDFLKFKTDDGLEFDSYEEAQNHEARQALAGYKVTYEAQGSPLGPWRLLIGWIEPNKHLAACIVHYLDQKLKTNKETNNDDK